MCCREFGLIAFSTLMMPVAAVQFPPTVYLPTIFAQQFGVSLSVLGLIFLVEKLRGTLADPIVGALSDRSRSRFGRRRSWIVAGSMIFCVSGVFLFFPQSSVSPIYLGVMLFLFYFGLSMIQIPFFAWSGELSNDYDERTRIETYQSVASSIALLLIIRRVAGGTKIRWELSVPPWYIGRPLLPVSRRGSRRLR